MIDARDRARALVELRLRARKRLPIVEFVPAASNPADPYEAPIHLSRVASLVEASEVRNVRAVFSLPPRHSKTETLLYAIARRLLRAPATRIAYISYGFEIAREKSRRCREIALRAGVKLARHGADSYWETTAGGGLYATSIKGTVTGKGFDLIIIDDPHKNRAEAESPLHRRTIYDFVTSTALTRLEPDSSAFICHTRWHPDDLIGRMLKKGGWENVCLPAVNDLGEDGLPRDPARPLGAALWPTRWTLAALQQKRAEVDEYDWHSLYQCSPRGRGESVFRNTYFYDRYPAGPRYAIGIDLAYSDEKLADYSVAVVLAASKGKYYVVDVLRMQCEAPVFADRLKQLQAKYRGAKSLWYASGTEKGNAQFFRKLGVKIRAKAAIADKFVRAQPVAAAWNREEILLPSTTACTEPEATREDRERCEIAPAWVDSFVNEVTSFTGVSDPHDDIVDALGAAYDALQTGDRDGDPDLPPIVTYDSPLA